MEISKHPSNPRKRGYRPLKRFPEGIDRLDIEANLPVTEGRIEGWVDELFLGGGMKPLVGYMILRHRAWREAMNVAREAHPRLAFRAAWALEWAYEQGGPEGRPEWFFERLIGDFTATPSGGIHRIYAKMLVDAIRFEGVQPTEVQVETLAECCFDLVIAATTKPATKFWCLELLAAFAPRVGWVAEQLPAIILRLSEAPDCSPAMRVATRSLLGRI